MCGIVALISTNGRQLDETVPDLEKSLDGALDRIKHRGPDGRGIWVSDTRSVALAHCRLSINDLTPSGSQPLHSSTGIHAVVNGELYDYDALRASLEARGYTFTSGSDSELVLYLYEEYGLGLTDFLRGEFAIVLHDAREGKGETVVLRDRYGIKPMFVRRVPLAQTQTQTRTTGTDGKVEDGGQRGQAGKGETIMLAAEMKAFLELGWEPEWDVRAIADGGWGQDTRTVFTGVEKLRPGHMMVIKDGNVDVRAFWDATYPDKTATETRSETEMITQTRDLLIESVAHRLRADVPVGIYLSGGIDSSAIAGIADYLVRERGLTMGKSDSDHSERICCFSIAFESDSGHDESDISRRSADHLGVRFITKYMDEQALADAFEEATYSAEHHNHDLNFVGKHALSRLPRQYGYKVVLTGEGSDEHFGGYPLYLPDYLSARDEGNGLTEGEREGMREKMVRQTEKAYEMIGADSTFITATPRGEDGAVDWTQGHLPIYTAGAMLAFLPSHTILSTSALQSLGNIDPLSTVASNITPTVRQDIMHKWHPLNSAMYVWGKGHLANQFLSCLGDRVEMAHSVEARTPFLDHVLAEHVNGLPISMKVRTVRGGNVAGALQTEGVADLKDSGANGSLGGEVSSQTGGTRDTKGKGDIDDITFVEKYALREAVKPFVTDEVYKRTKYPYSAPSTYPPDGPVNRLLDRLVSQKRVEQLGWVDWATMSELKGRAFGSAKGEADVGAWRQVLMVAEWTILAERFGVKTWTTG